jgi:hypothetical protein
VSDPKRIHTREQREAEATDLACQVAAFYKTLRARGVPSAPAQAATEAYVEGLLAGEVPPEPWQG